MKRDLQGFSLLAQVSRSGEGKKNLCGLCLAADPTRNEFPEHTWKNPEETKACERWTASCGMSERATCTHTGKLSVGAEEPLSELLLQSVSLPSFTLPPEEVVGV